MSNSPAPDDSTVRVASINIPLKWALSVAGVAAWGAVQTYFTVNLLVKTVEELQITVKSGNAATAVLQGEMTLLKFRMENLEAEIRAVKGKGGGQ